MLDNLKSRAAYALEGEDAGPSVEQIIGLAAALIIGTGIIMFANMAYGWISTAGKNVEGLDKGDNIPGSATGKTK